MHVCLEHQQLLNRTSFAAFEKGDEPSSVALSGTTAVVTGTFSSTFSATVNGFTQSIPYVGGTDSIAFGVDIQNGDIKWITSFGGLGGDEAWNVAIVDSFAVVVGWYTQGITFSSGRQLSHSGGGQKHYIVGLEVEDGHIEWAMSVGSAAGPEQPYGVAIHGATAVVAGSFVATFSATVGGASTAITHAGGTGTDHLVYLLKPNCRSGKTLNTLSCRSDAGYTGTGPSACAAGKYKEVSSSNAACTDCLTNSGTGTGTGSIAATDCLANAGYTGPDGGPFTACAIDSFKAATGSASCSTCPTNAGTVGATASTASAACSADAGYTGPDGGPFTACPIDSFKAATGSAECTGCSTNSGTGSSAGTAAESGCLADAGYTGSGSSVTACAANSYKAADTSATVCNKCPPTTSSVITASTTQDDCVPDTNPDTSGLVSPSAPALNGAPQTVQRECNSSLFENNWNLTKECMMNNVITIMAAGFLMCIAFLCIQRRAKKAINLPTIFGRKFVKGYKGGMVSFHFESPDNCFISYESDACADWPPQLRGQVPFLDPVFDEETSTFTGHVDWSSTPLGPVEDPVEGSMARWDYRMVFSEDMSEIEAGECKVLLTDGSEGEPQEFGCDLHYSYFM